MATAKKVKKKKGSLALPWALYHVFIPSALAASVIFRYNLLSGIYLLFLLVFPYAPSLRRQTKDKCMRYTIGLVVVSTLFVIGQISFQIALLTQSPYGSLVGDFCSDMAKLMRYIGFERLDKMSVGNIFRVLLPDVVCFLVAVCTFITLRKIEKATSVETKQKALSKVGADGDAAPVATTSLDAQNTSIQSAGTNKEKNKKEFYVSATRIKNGCLLFFIVLFMALAGIAQPSLVSAVYLLMFIAMATTWSFHGRLLTLGLVVTEIIISFLTATELMVYYLYQIEFFYTALPPTTLTARLLGLVQIFQTSCSLPYQLLFVVPVQWTSIVSPIVIFVLHWLLAAGVRLYFASDKTKLQPQKARFGKRRKIKKDDKTPLVSSESPTAGYGTDEQGTSREMKDLTEDGHEVKAVPSGGVMSYVATVMSSLKHQSFYVFALIIMMAWSVTFHSWLTLVLLVWSCILWLVKDRAWATLCCSPVFTIYGIMLLLLQFVYSLNLTDAELPLNVTLPSNKPLNLADFGCVKYPVPFLMLGAQILYLCVFWLVLHQFVFIRRNKEQQQVGGTMTPWVKAFSEFCFDMLCKYWILVVYAFLIAVCMDGAPSGIKLIYAVLLCLNAFAYEFSWSLWMKSLSAFLMVLVVYTMIAVLLIYTYQFTEFPGYWKSFTNFTDTQLADLGLVQYTKKSELFVRIFIPTLFLLVVILEKHYFLTHFIKKVKYRMKIANVTVHDSTDGNAVNHDDEASITSRETAEASPVDDAVEKEEHTTWQTKCKHCIKCVGNALLCTWYHLVDVAWRLLEFHTWKWMAVTVLVAAVQNVSVLSAVLFVIWIIMLPMTTLHTLLYFATCVYVWLVILAGMFYQMNFITELQNKETLSQNCTFAFYGSTFTYNGDFISWIGFHKMAADGSFFYYAIAFIVIAIMLAVERTAVRRMDWRRKYCNDEKFKLTAVYPQVTHAHVDTGIIECAKYLINYWFYKLGLETCYVMAAIAIWVRMDMYGSIYALLLIGAVFIKTRHGLRIYFGFYAAALTLLLLWQFFAALGMPSIWCKNNEYSWTEISHTNVTERNRLVRWIYLPDYIIPPISRYLTVDVFQLIFVLCQLRVFHRETSPVCLENAGKNNYLTTAELNNITPENNPRNNFMDRNSRTLLDQVKVVIFKYSFWLTAALVFIAGTSRISLFCMGYFAAFFYIMSFNEALLMGKPSRLLKIWNLVLGYNLSVIFLKVSLQVASCVYIDVLNREACPFVQLFSLGCSKPADYYNLTVDTVNGACEVPDSYTNSGVTMDFVCFFFLVFQRRIFRSLYFRHVADDMRISMKLASRGAQLFQEKLVEEVTRIREEDAEGLAKIRQSILKVKQKYRDLLKGRVPESHMEATREGDYYMFQDVNYHRYLQYSTQYKKEQTKDDTLAITEVGEKDQEEDKQLDDEKQEDDASDGLQLAKVVEEETCEGEEEEHKEGLLSRMWNVLMSLIRKVTDWVTLTLNKINCDYRNVALHLAAEKDILTEENIQNLRKKRLREETNITFETEDNAESSSHSNNDDTAVLHKDESQTKTVEGKTMTNRDSIIITNKEWPQWTDLKPDEFDENQMLPIRLFYAIWYTVISRTQLLCYFLIILNLMLSASLISLVLPFAVYLWASLSVPRPSKRFWMFCIYYTEIVILIKFLFQFEFMPWNKDVNANLYLHDPGWWPRVLGVEQKDRWSAMDLATLLALFFHRSLLKVQGVWDDAECNNGNKTNSTDEEQQSQELAIPEEEVVDLGDIIVEEIEGGQISRIDDVIEQEDDGASSEEEIPSGFKMKARAVLLTPYNFIRALLHQEFNAVVDVYIYTFLCDVLNFIIIIFGYWAFGKYSSTKGDVVSNITGNRVPSGFLAMLLFQFSMMIIDRGIYLKKSVIGKLIFQFILVIGIHIWMFFILPAINGRPFYENGVAQTWYFFKFIYFLLSAYQIRCGYPSRVLGNFLTKAYGTPNLFLFKGYRAIPFLVELSAIMDWMFIETTMGVGEWMKLNSIYAEVFELKCWRVFEKNYPGPRGEAKGHVVKYLVGGLLVFLLIAIIWFPLLFMNLALTIGGVVNNPTQVSVQINCGTFEPLFQVITDADYMTVYNQSQLNALNAKFASNQAAAQFLSQYTPEQIVSVRINGVSNTIWTISPPQNQSFIDRLNPSNTKNFDITFEWKLLRDSSKTNVPQTIGRNRITMKPNNKIRDELYTLLTNKSAITASIPQMYPKYLYASSTSKTDAATKLYTNGTADYVTVDLGLPDMNDNYTKSINTKYDTWWTVTEIGGSVSSGFEIVIFSDKVSPSVLRGLASYGIVGLYVSVVLVVGKLVRGIFGSTTNQIMTQELPNVDKIDQLCRDIFLVREEKFFSMEEDLFAKLIFLYRSPVTLIEWTRPKVE